MFTALALTLMLTSCYTTYTVSQQPELSKLYVGSTHQSIVSRLGAPDRQTPDGAGGTILIYENITSQSIATAHNVNYYTGTYTPGVRTTSHTDYIHIYINSQGKCYNVKTNKTKIVSEYDRKATLWTVFGTIGAFVLATVILIAAGSGA